MILRLAVLALAVLLASTPARAQAPDGMARLENAASAVEQSTFNKALPLFADLYWGFQPQRFQRPTSGVYVWMPDEGLDREAMFNPVATYATAALNANMSRLSVYARVVCRDLTPQQRAFLTAFTQARYAALVGVYDARKADIARAMEAPLGSIEAARLATDPACARTAAAGDGGVSLSTDLMLIALLSAMYVDQLGVLVPDRTAVRVRQVFAGTADAWDNQRGRRLEARLRATPVWTNVLRSARVLGEMEYMSLEAFEKERIHEAYEASRPECRSRKKHCRTWNAATLAFTSAAKVDLLFTEQIDFMLAHEIGHHALGHVTQALGSCEAEKAREASADMFAIALMRPPEGLFNRPENYEEDRFLFARTDNRFASGADLFMSQSHRLALLQDGDNCAYPPFRERRQVVRDFEKRAWPR